MKYVVMGLIALASFSATAKDEACLRMIVEPENFSVVSHFLKTNKVDFKLQSNHFNSTVMFHKGSTLTVFTKSSLDIYEKLKKNDIIQSMDAEKFPCDMYRAAADIQKL